MSSYKNILRLWKHLSPKRQRQFFLLSLLMLLSAVAEVASLGSVLPFLGILVSPEKVFNHPAAAQFCSIFAIKSPSQLVLPLTALFAAMALLAGMFRMLLLWVSTRVVYASGADLSMELYRRTLYQPYQVHIARNSSSVISGMSKVEVAVSTMSQSLLLTSSSILLVAIISALIAIDPAVASLAAIGFGASYCLIAWFSRSKLDRNSKRIALERNYVIKSLQEGLGGIRDVLLDGSQSVYCDIYRRADLPLRKAQGNNAFLTQSPRFAMETLGMVLIALLAYALSLKDGGIATALPVLGALAIGAQRLLPCLQQVYSAWSHIIGSQHSLIDTLSFLDQSIPEEMLQQNDASLDFKHSIKFDSVFFRYKKDSSFVIDNINFSIEKGSRIGFVGETGSGKSTTLDLLMGLLTPSDGRLLVDNWEITGNYIKPWQRMIAHVPQSIYLSDSTIAENIALGTALEKIDMERVHRAARQAHIEGFIESLPDGYNAYVGERGVLLSGGQRQRIGIARALYKQACVLVFDEATSALDNTTESSVMEAIDGLDESLTIILIAHRLSTLRQCNTIFVMDKGKVVAQGNYKDLIESCDIFKKMDSVLEKA
jgi:ABC-type multidrug transport system fused ATPase/permease subunit